ncbi:hypothetical protein BOW16_11510 [Solemya velum gill symbiont]|uniref:hypothetical protein n=1 Tax=Solemya velum gill symbiont TaxID=2340 RepID=UPI0009962E7E|nr:hypothetical protein [Solemya velum gill symbiont]OOY53647.1 hypothetical protein BOV97_00010 [Solemya velum gill symbiont]OOY57440.1 hypothetical protein BOV99_00025 [Solemya velum gill symbiont]OOY58464.1 hypothetical protein BOW00_00025 [Solemya velum gill symbiont]OOY61108.1 hypothetical protein BOW02_01550 [Solemya velum gill symbiont]OOY62637.1 hypothetical protein BOW04_03150 [Solemya velum gill symbiont]
MYSAVLSFKKLFQKILENPTRTRCYNYRNRVIDEAIAEKNCLAMIEKIQPAVELADVNEEEYTQRRSQVIMLESEVEYMEIMRRKAPVDVQRAFAESILLSRMMPLENEIRSGETFDTRVHLSEEAVKRRRKEVWQLHTRLKEVERESKLASDP